MKNLGILIEKVSEERIEGCLVDTELSLKVKEDGGLCIEEKVNKICFELMLGDKKKVCEVKEGTSLVEAKRITRALKEVGFTDVVLWFNDTEYYVTE